MPLLKVDIFEISLITESKQKILSNISFSLEQGYIYSIFGSNGSGKTTLLLSIANLLNKNIFAISGNILFEGKDILASAESEIQALRKNSIRYIFQNPSMMFDPLKKMKYYSDMIADKFFLSELFNKSLLPDLNSVSGKYFYEFSEGQLQRIALCLAIAAKPKLLILDEPTSSLDPINSNIIKNLLLAFRNKNNSVLIVTHDKFFAENVSDFIGEIFGGSFNQFSSNVVNYDLQN
jgi:ABC-type glutathione transport system ATPase component